MGTPPLFWAGRPRNHSKTLALTSVSKEGRGFSQKRAQRCAALRTVVRRRMLAARGHYRAHSPLCSSTYLYRPIESVSRASSGEPHGGIAGFLV